MRKGKIRTVLNGQAGDHRLMAGIRRTDRHHARRIESVDTFSAVAAWRQENRVPCVRSLQSGV
jgi:hypothetical protein